MQPYQKEAQASAESGSNILSAAKYAGASAIGGGLAKSGYGLVSKIGAFLSPYLPEDIARKGLSKVDPRIGKFIDKAMNAGADFNELKGFIGDKISKQPAEDKNVIEKSSPELHQFLSEEVKKGTDLYKAGAVARLNKKFDKVIDKMEKENKSSWSSILETVYGSSKTKQPTTEQPMQNQQQQQQAGGDDKWNKIAASLQGLLNS